MWTIGAGVASAAAGSFQGRPGLSGAVREWIGFSEEGLGFRVPFGVP